LLSTNELHEATVLTADPLNSFRVNANLEAGAEAAPIITFILVQEWGFLTGIYKHYTPLIQSSVFFRDLTAAQFVNRGATSRFKILLEDGRACLLYLTPRSSWVWRSQKREAACAFRAGRDLMGSFKSRSYHLAAMKRCMTAVLGPLPCPGLPVVGLMMMIEEFTPYMGQGMIEKLIVRLNLPFHTTSIPLIH